MKDTQTFQRERVDAIEFVDVMFQVLAAQISGNYLKHIKTKLIPLLSDYPDFPLRELRTLMCVAHFDYPVKASTIVKVMGYDPATVTRSTRTLIERGMLVSQANERDARSTVYALTDVGEEFTTAYRAVAKRMTVELNKNDPMRPTNAELEHAVDVLIRLRDRSALAEKVIY